jgi:DNA-directed RNA polymerase specialized sigma subunit
MYDTIKDNFVGHKENFCDSELDDNSLERKKMFRILEKAMETELTDKQFYYITEYYYKNKKIKDIAKEAGVCSSTVSRSIAVATSKLKKIARYFDVLIN